MTTKLIPITLLFALGFGTFSPAQAQEANVDGSVRVLPIRAESSLQIETNIREKVEALKAEAEARTPYINPERFRLGIEGEERARASSTATERRAQAETRREEAQTRRVEFQREAASRKVEHVTRVMSATIERLERIIERIESRMARLEANGGDTSASAALIAEARVSLDQASVTVNAFASIDLSSDSAQENFERIRAAAAEARESIRATHSSMVEAVTLLGRVQASISSDGDADDAEEAEDEPEENESEDITGDNEQ